jgi:hypothetical protein
MDTQRAALLFSMASIAGCQRRKWHIMVDELAVPNARIDGIKFGFTARVPNFYNDESASWKKKYYF